MVMTFPRSGEESPAGARASGVGGEAGGQLYHPFAGSLLHGETARAIGLVAQSGALGMALAQAVTRGVSFSHVLTSGNSCDVDMADYVAYLAEEPACRAIACTFEGMADPKRLIEVDLPIKRVSAHARREKSIRHGHISTLHIWWARRLCGAVAGPGG